MKVVRIGGAYGFWGDRPDALGELLQGGPLDYVIMDYLAELTMSILQKQRARDPQAGFPPDFVAVAARALPLLRKQGIKLVANAGGLNPVGCARALAAAAAAAGFPDLAIGVVDGDDLLPRLDELAAAGIDLANMDTGASQQDMPGPPLAANAYLGAFPIAAALAAGAEIVITGRVNDAALALGPLIHEFGWQPHQYDLLAAGTIAGHLLECGAQASGGNFNGGWQEVPGLVGLGYPIAEVSNDGTITMTIHEGQGGLVTPAVLKEQLLYEIGDPAAYLTADVATDITGLGLAQDGLNRVRVEGARGAAPPDSYKVSMSHAGGYQVAVGLVYTWPDCLAKARAGADLLLARLDRLGIRYLDHLVSIFGYDGMHGPMSHPLADPNEVYMRASFLLADAKTGERIAREAVTHILAGIPTACPLEPEVSRPREQVVYWPSLVPKTAVQPRVQLLRGYDLSPVPFVEPTPAPASVEESVVAMTPHPKPRSPEGTDPAGRGGSRKDPLPVGEGKTVPLAIIAHGRSGDKGDTLNCGIIARRPEYYPVLLEQVTAERVKAHFGDFCRGTVTCYDLPLLQACNFVLTKALGGGGTASLRIDPLGKTYAAALMRLPVQVPADWPR